MPDLCLADALFLAALFAASFDGRTLVSGSVVLSLKQAAMFKEFKEFIAKGNVLELAVGVILAAAFGAVVKAFTDGVMMPPIGLVLGGVDFSDLAVVLKDGAGVEGTETYVEPVLLKWGYFVQMVIDFLIIALVLFMVIKAYNNFLRKKEVTPDEVPPASTKEEILLKEIRDLLARGR